MRAISLPRARNRSPVQFNNRGFNSSCLSNKRLQCCIGARWHLSLRARGSSFILERREHNVVSGKPGSSTQKLQPTMARDRHGTNPRERSDEGFASQRRTQSGDKRAGVFRKDKI